MLPWLMTVLALGGCDGATGIGPTGGESSVVLTRATSAPLSDAGDTLRINAIARDEFGNVLPASRLTWGSSAPAVATVAPSGIGAVVTAVTPGSAIITATLSTLNGPVQGKLTVTVGGGGVNIVIGAVPERPGLEIGVPPSSR
jgi:hypothetical protein